MSPDDEVFSDADLEPTPEEERALRRARADFVATLVALAAIAVWAGSLVATRWCAGPALGASLPESVAHSVLTAMRERTDQLGMGAALVVLGCEILRTLVTPGRGRPLGPRLRRLCGIVAAAAAAYVALVLGPIAARATQAGIVPGLGPAGGELARLEARGELLRLAELGRLGLLLGLQLGTLRRRVASDPAENEAEAPLPPGPAPKAPA